MSTTKKAFTAMDFADVGRTFLTLGMDAAGDPRSAIFAADCHSISVLAAHVVMALEYDPIAARQESRFVNSVASYWATLVGPVPLVNYTHDHLCRLYGSYGTARVNQLVRAMGVAELAWRKRFN